ncbi:hypothetical protein N2152v2_004799 [Parachlorella kessleri]
MSVRLTSSRAAAKRTKKPPAYFKDYVVDDAGGEVEDSRKRVKMDQGNEASPEAGLLGCEERIPEAVPEAGSGAGVAGGDGADPEYVISGGEGSKKPETTRAANKQPRVVLSAVDQAQAELSPEEVTRRLAHMTSVAHASLKASAGQPGLVRHTSLVHELSAAASGLSPEECASKDTNCSQAKIEADHAACSRAAKKGWLKVSFGSWSTDSTVPTTGEHPSPTVKIRGHFQKRVAPDANVEWVIVDASGVPPDIRSKSGTEYNAAQQEIKSHWLLLYIMALLIIYPGLKGRLYLELWGYAVIMCFLLQGSDPRDFPLGLPILASTKYYQHLKAELKDLLGGMLGVAFLRHPSVAFTMYLGVRPSAVLDEALEMKEYRDLVALAEERGILAEVTPELRGPNNELLSLGHLDPMSMLKDEEGAKAAQNAHCVVGAHASHAKQRENPETYRAQRSAAAHASHAKQRENLEALRVAAADPSNVEARQKLEAYRAHRSAAGHASNAKQMENPEAYRAQKSAAAHAANAKQRENLEALRVAAADPSNVEARQKLEAYRAQRSAAGHASNAKQREKCARDQQAAEQQQQLSAMQAAIHYQQQQLIAMQAALHHQQLLSAMQANLHHQQRMAPNPQTLLAMQQLTSAQPSTLQQLAGPVQLTPQQLVQAQALALQHLGATIQQAPAPQPFGQLLVPES